MNTNKLKFIPLLIAGMVLSLFSCKDYLDVNTDPNQSVVSDVPLQLSYSQLQSAIGINQRIYPNISVWCQYHTGGPGVALGDPDQHKWAPSESNGVFTRLYRSSVNLQYILDNSQDDNYLAIAKILQAYNFQVCADLFGDIPFRDALKGDIADGSIYHPAYDNAERDVYPGIEQMLLEAIALIESGSPSHPGDDDLIYHGDMDKWKKFANTMLLKAYLRIGDGPKIVALYQSDDQFIISNDDNALVPFTAGSTGAYPFWNEAKSTALGNFYVATTTILDHLINTGDPRIGYFFDEASPGMHNGLYPGDIENAPPNAAYSRPAGALAPNGGLIFSPEAPVIFMSAWEGNLLLAEAASRFGISSDMNAAYEAGVNASFEYLGVPAADAATYLAAGGALDMGNPIKSIALQKWTCMNGLQPIESWIETRRLDSPATPVFSSPGGIFQSPTKNALGPGIFPSILPYPENEQSLNKNFIGQHPITDKVFWDN